MTEKNGALLETYNPFSHLCLLFPKTDVQNIAEAFAGFLGKEEVIYFKRTRENCLISGNTSTGEQNLGRTGTID